MKITKIILLTIIFSLFTLHSSALSFSNFSYGGVGFVNNGNGYFDDTNIAFNYTGNRNVFVVAEDTQIWIFEPISRSSGAGAAYALINSSVGSITSAVVRDGYLYFIDNNVLKKRLTRNIGSLCESTDTSAGGCVSIIVASGVGTIATRGTTLYFTQGTSLKHLDENDITVSDFTLQTITGAGSQYSSMAVLENATSGFTEAYVTAYSGAQVFLYRCRSTGCSPVGGSISNNGVETSAFFTTSNYLYALQFVSTGNSAERLYRISNGSVSNVDYVTDNTITRAGRVFVGGQSTIGLAAQSTTTYETFNAIEAGQDSLPTTEGSGIVQYVNKEINVPNPTYYNDSTIPINVNLKFIISDTNHTNYLTTATWHLLAFDPTGVMVEDHDLPIVCTQTQPWWDPFGVLSLFIVDLTTPWACDGTQTVQYSPNPGQFWMNGTWTIELTEQIPGTTSILSTDTYNIVNQSSTGTGVVNPPVSCPTCGLGGGTINVNTSLQLIEVFRFVAFWGFIIWLGIVGTIIKAMASSQSGVNGMAVIVVAWLSAVFIALVGLFDPFKIYVIVLSTIIAAVLFRFGKNATTTED